MKRNLTFHKDGVGTAEALGISQERHDELIGFICEKMDGNTTMAGLVTAMNERGDLTDNEWVFFIFALGVMAGSGSIDFSENAPA